MNEGIRQEGGAVPLFQNLHQRLKTIDGAVDVYCEILARYSKAEISQADARTMAYLMAGLLAYHKHVDDLRLEARIEALESQSNKSNRGTA